MNTITEALQWRYATKKYEPSKKVAAEKVDSILEAGRLAASSYGLQPITILHVKDASTREALVAHSWGQKQVSEASDLFVLCVNKTVEPALVDEYMERIVKTRNIPAEAISGFGDYVKGAVSGMSDDQKLVWNQKQAYIVLGSMLAEAAVQQVDATPMEGFVPDGYNEVLNLTEKGLVATLVMPIGYRHEDDQTQHNVKVRKSKDEFVKTV